MAIENQEAFDTWKLLKPDTVFAVRTLSCALEDPHGSPEEILEAYLYAKQALARSMQPLLRSQLPQSGKAFDDLRERIQGKIYARYGDVVPKKYLRVPYGTKSNAELFAVLHQKLGEPVDIARLRTINRDDVHTERRIRELRELGLDVTATIVNDRQHYILASLDLDEERIHELVAKKVKNATGLKGEEKKDLLRRLLRMSPDF